MRRARAIIVIALLIAVSVRHANATDCPGDLNNDRVVTVDEIIRAVNAGLKGCGSGLATAAPTDCPGDLNGDQAVTLDEIIAAVNAGINGCDASPTPTATATPAPVVTATPTPADITTRCPHTFMEAFPTGTACSYAGGFTTASGCPSDLEVLLTSDGSLVAVGVGSDPIVTLGAVATSPTSATLTAYLVGADPVTHAIAGVIELRDNGHTLIVDPSGPFPFGIGGPTCPFDRYAGSFTRVFGGQVAMATGF